MQAGVRLLEHHRDAVAADRVQLLLAEVDEVDAVEAHAARHDATRLVDEPQHRQHRDALARAGLADEAEHLTPAHREVDAVDGVHVAAAGAEPRAQSGHLEQRRRVDRAGSLTGVASMA